MSMSLLIWTFYTLMGLHHPMDFRPCMEFLFSNPSQGSSSNRENNEQNPSYKPVLGHDPSVCSSSARNTNIPLAHRAFQYVAVKFKRLFTSHTDKEAFCFADSGFGTR
ncbi:hypothetical protein M5689_013545 [Euphorbia peplus]|nr:hypothetical protein M5689_013545 [Euphorbia peplus]